MESESCSGFSTFVGNINAEILMKCLTVIDWVVGQFHSEKFAYHGKGLELDIPLRRIFRYRGPGRRISSAPTTSTMHEVHTS